MNKKLRTTGKKVLASLMVILFLSGFTGFNIEEHKCAHCGIDYSIIFLEAGNTQENNCSHNSNETCCSDKELQNSDMSLPAICDIEAEECCKYDYNEVSISDPLNLVSVEFSFDTPAYPGSIIINKADNSNPAFLRIASSPKRLSGRELVVLNSQFIS